MNRFLIWALLRLTFSSPERLDRCRLSEAAPSHARRFSSSENSPRLAWHGESSRAIVRGSKEFGRGNSGGQQVLTRSVGTLFRKLHPAHEGQESRFGVHGIEGGVTLQPDHSARARGISLLQPCDCLVLLSQKRKVLRNPIIARPNGTYGSCYGKCPVMRLTGT
jgi:hypothetical protein